MNDQKSILIVDDEVMFSASLKKQLEKEGYVVCGCLTTGEEAVDFVDEHKTDVILMDINLVGEIDGVEAAKQIHKKSNIPLIILTGYGDKRNIERAKKIEYVAYVTKPIYFRQLKLIIDSIFKEV